MTARGLAEPAGGPARNRSVVTSSVGVLLVDDSLVVRRLVGRVIETEPDLELVGEATEGRTGLHLTRSLQPDVVVLDLEMPGMNGYDMLRAIEAENLGSQLIVFANVEPEDRAAVEAKVRASGAELVAKPTGVADAEQAVARIRACLLEPLRRQAGQAGHGTPAPVTPGARRITDAVVIASSTGGPNALEVVLGGVSDLRVPVFIVQHIAGGFSGRLADRLDSICRFPVHEVVDGQRPEPGHAYVGPGGIHLCVERDDGGAVLRLRDLPPVNSCRPSADVLFRSSAEVYGGNQVGLVLTGIGRDGFDGCAELAARGASILVQDEETSVVWGMPGTVATAGLADEILPLEAIAGRLQHLINAGTATQRSKGSGS